MVTSLVFGLIILGAIIAPFWLLPACGVWGIAAWTASKAGSLDADNLAAVLFTLAVLGIVFQLIGI